MFKWVTSKQGAIAVSAGFVAMLFALVVGLIVTSGAEVGAPERTGVAGDEASPTTTTTAPPPAPTEEVVLGEDDAAALAAYFEALAAGEQVQEPPLFDYVPPAPSLVAPDEPAVDVPGEYTLPDTQPTPVDPPSPEYPMPDNPFGGPGLSFAGQRDMSAGVRQYMFNVSGGSVQERCDAALAAISSSGFSVSWSECIASGLAASLYGNGFAGNASSFADGTQLNIELRL